VVLIANPKAGKGHGVAVAGEIATALGGEAAGVSIEVTAGPGDARRIAVAAARDARAVVAVGGDGTLHEVGGGVADAAALAGDPAAVAAVGVVPVGGGNDFVKSLGLDPSVRSIARWLASARRRRIDLLRVTRGPAAPEWGLNQVSIGFGGKCMEVLEPVRRYVSGFAAYAATGIWGLFRYEAPDFRIVLDDARPVAGRFLEVHVANGAFCGGGISFVRAARPDDGCIDVCLMDDRTVGWNFRALIPVAIARPRPRDGVRFDRARTVAVDSSARVAYHIDGELRHKDAAERLVVTIVPSALDVLVPPAA
jgi:diacylglycerol kinase (ATP)